MCRLKDLHVSLGWFHTGPVGWRTEAFTVGLSRVKGEKGTGGQSQIYPLIPGHEASFSSFR